MYDHEMRTRMQQTWPETTDYLRRVGQVTNDLMVLREMQQAEGYEASLTWLDQLEVDVEDLTATPTGAAVLRFLHQQGTMVRSATQVLEYLELQQEHERAFQEGYGSSPDLLDDPAFSLTSESDARMWAIPELQTALIEWATATANRHGRPGKVSLTQAAILMRVTQFLEQEPEHSPGWAAECLQSALSSGFFEQAANPAA